MSNHKVEDYKDAEGQWRWRVIAVGTKDSAVEDHIVGDSGQGYSNRSAMLKSFFGIFFGDYDDSWLALYNEWNPEAGQVDYQPVSSIQAAEDQHASGE